jgi:glycine/D-amino acid oxidase-like deaminating enzyme
MIIDAREIAPGSTVVCEICIVGSGAAGITVAHELLGQGKDVALLEGGSLRREAAAQELYQGEVVDAERHGALDQYRQRRFGGTTTVWGGRCAPFDEIDFEARPHVPYSGWPISKRDLDSYYSRAHEYCELGAYVYTAREALPDGPPSLIPGFRANGVLDDSLWRFSPPTDFGKRYREALRRSASARLYLHANCLKLPMGPGGAIERIEAASAPGHTFTVKARQFVLAAGGLEVPRLLLASRAGNDLTGRFYISHITGDAGEVVCTPRGGDVVWGYERTPDGIYCRRSMAISAERQRREGLLNFRAILSHPPPADPSHGNGILSSMYLMKALLAHRIPPEYSGELSGMRTMRHIGAHCGNIAGDVPALIAFSRTWLRKRVFSGRKLPSVSFRGRNNVYTMHFDAEQSPNPDSRVTLSDQTDRFGIPRLRVDWRPSGRDVESVVRCCRILGKALDASGVGRLLFDPEQVAETIRRTSGVGSHHIGATRMAADASRGVVDADCRVYGTQNLFIAGPSVFPTSSFANPTLTAVALAIRLAEHLAGRPARGGQ